MSCRSITIRKSCLRVECLKKETISINLSVTPMKVKHLVGKYFIRVSDTESETIRKREAIWIRGLKHMEAQRELTKQSGGPRKLTKDMIKAMRGMGTVRPNMTDEPLSDELKTKMKLNGGPNQ
ncbi:hypothetical protein LXL04_032025 [Taraxacum kok-saghyz]